MDESSWMRWMKKMDEKWMKSKDGKFIWKNWMKSYYNG